MKKLLLAKIPLVLKLSVLSLHLPAVTYEALVKYQRIRQTSCSLVSRQSTVSHVNFQHTS